MNGDRYGLQHRCVHKRKIIRQTVQNAGRNDDIFGKSSGATIVSAGDSQNLPVVAEVHFSTATRTTNATVNGRIECDPVTQCEALYSTAHRGDSSRSFVPHHNGRNA